MGGDGGSLCRHVSIAEHILFIRKVFARMLFSRIAFKEIFNCYVIYYVIFGMIYQHSKGQRVLAISLGYFFLRNSASAKFRENQTLAEFSEFTVYHDVGGSFYIV